MPQTLESPNYTRLPKSSRSSRAQYILAVDSSFPFPHLSSLIFLYLCYNQLILQTESVLCKVFRGAGLF